MGWAVNDDNAVSETLGYILIFMIVLTCIAFILLAGNGVLDSTKAQNNFKSMEQGLTIVSSDLTQVALEGTPVKTTRIHMEGGSVSAKADAASQITITYPDTNFTNNPYPASNTGRIMFTSDKDNGIVSIENGGLWEKQGVSNGDIAVLKPHIYETVDPATHAQTLVLNIIKLDANPESSIGGSATMDVKLSYEQTRVYSYDASNAPTGKDVGITFDTKYPNAWERFFKEIDPSATVSHSDTQVTATFPQVSKLIISEHTVGVLIN